MLSLVSEMPTKDLGIASVSEKDLFDDASLRARDTGHLNINSVDHFRRANPEFTANEKPRFETMAGRTNVECNPAGAGLFIPAHGPNEPRRFRAERQALQSGRGRLHRLAPPFPPAPSPPLRASLP